MKKLLNVSAWLAIIAGVVLVAGGTWGIWFTYQNVAQENIVTPSDASIPNTRVLGPLTLRSQAEVIQKHALSIANGNTYAEMPRFISKLDEQGSPVFDENGEAVMIANTNRDMWITATTLTTALNLAIVTYLLSALVLLFGCISIWTGVVFCTLSRKGKCACSE